MIIFLPGQMSPNPISCREPALGDALLDRGFGSQPLITEPNPVYGKHQSILYPEKCHPDIWTPGHLSLPGQMSPGQTGTGVNGTRARVGTR